MDAASLYLVGRRLSALAERAMAAPEGLPAQPTAELLVLRAVIERPGTTVTDLVTQLSLAQSRISQAVAALERDGYVRRYTDAEDRRRQRIEPTEQFKKDIEQRMARKAEDALEPLLGHVTPRDRTRVLSALELLHDLIRQTDERETSEP
ncbi:MarR family winged helix-turn-helix transcriptional regulator [Polyangium aurulentum]|uniref:MarR family winged helix-turn-helix transcriptional regulator n=1 Tax=Polyangium aurulentum TaxID=2567896 RepID=UPI0010AE78F5|nr:MarR family transcriptional regulator [Polyangium aurulentum]UQA60627.1 MarR family transcriptional regulator [Polyangium aurulentum]